MLTLDRIRTSRVTCESAPAQIEGQLDDGRFFYFRARGRYAELGIGATAEEAVAATILGRGELRPTIYASTPPHEEYFGYSCVDAYSTEAKKLLAQLLAQIES